MRQQAQCDRPNATGNVRRPKNNFPISSISMAGKCYVSQLYIIISYQ